MAEDAPGSRAEIAVDGVRDNVNATTGDVRSAVFSLFYNF